MQSNLSELTQAAVAVIGIVGAGVSGYVAVSVRALREELGRKLAEQENSIIERINGTYVRRAECSLREDRIMDRLNHIDKELE